MSAAREENRNHDRDRILDALAQYQKQGIISDNVGDMAEMLMDESDRGVVVILGSLIEDILLDELVERFVPLEGKDRKNLVRAGGPLSSFDHRIKIAQAMGLIDADMVDTLQIVKAMRNACAHSRRDINFQTDELRNTLSLLFHEEISDVIRKSGPKRDTLYFRYLFIVAFVVITSRLKGDTEEDALAKGQRLMDAALHAAREEVQRHAGLLRKRKAKKDENRRRTKPKD